MTNTSNQVDDQAGAIKDPDEWVTGDEPMTGAQESYLRTLSRQAGEEFDEKLKMPMPQSVSKNCKTKLVAVHPIRNSSASGTVANGCPALFVLVSDRYACPHCPQSR